MKINIKTPALSAVAFFGTLGMLSVGYSAYVSNYPATATAGVTALSAGEWNKMVSALQTLDGKLSTFSMSGSSAGIGIAPISPLHVYTSANVMTSGYTRIATFQGAHPTIQFKGMSDTGHSAFIGFDAQSSVEGLRFWVGQSGDDHGGTSTALMHIKPSGYVGIGISAPSNKLHVNGNIGATGWVGAGCETACSDVASGYAIMYPDGRGISTVGWTTNSDIRIKKDIRPINDPVGKIKKINGILYKLKDGDESDKIGVVAQEVEVVFPELVSETASGIKTVNYDKLVAPLIEVAKIHESEIEALKSKNEELSKKLAEVLSKLESISK